MAQISTNKTGGVVRWDSSDWLAGLIPQWGIDTTRALAQKGFSTSTGIDPHRFPGYCSPGVNPVDPTNASAVTAMLKDGSVSGSSAYLVGGTLLHKIADVTLPAITDDATWPITVSPHGGHSGLALSSTAIYTIGSTKYLFYSWSDSADGDVGRFDLSSTTDDDFMSTTPAGGAVLDTTNEHALIVGDDDVLYIADGPNLHGFDGQNGANGTLSKNRLSLPSDYVITSFAKTQNFLVIYAYRANASTSYYRSEATAFFWDYVSEDPTYKYPLQGNYVNGGFTFQGGRPGCFVEGQSTHVTATKTSKMLLYDGSGFKTIITFTDDAPGHGGVEVYDETVLWNSEGQIYQWGDPHGIAGNSLNRVTKLGGTTTGGMLRNFARNRLVASAGTGTNGGAEYLYAGYYPATLTTSTVDLPCPEDFKAELQAVKIFYQSTRTAGSHTFSLVVYTDRAQNNATIIEPVGYVGSDRQDPSTSLVAIYRDTYNAKALGTASSLALNMTWNNGDGTKKPVIIEAVEVYFKYIRV